MGIKFQSNDGDDDGALVAAINVTPLVDVMLVLLIIFIVTAPLALSTVPVKLPAAGLEEMGKPVDPLVLSTDLRGVFYLEENHRTVQFTAAELEPRLREVYERYKPFVGKARFPVVYIRADRATEYGKVYATVKTLSKVGFYRVSLMTEAPR